VIVRAAPPEHYQYLVERAGVTPSPLFKAIEAVDGKGTVHGMFGYDAWTANAVVMHVALDSPVVLRRLIMPAFEYPFVQLGLGVALCAIRGDNERSLKLTERVGFKRVYTIRNCFGGGVDQMIYEMRREDCEWIAPGARKAA
jgi:hypothetical protein